MHQRNSDKRRTQINIKPLPQKSIIQSVLKKEKSEKRECEKNTSRVNKSTTEKEKRKKRRKFIDYISITFSIHQQPIDVDTREPFVPFFHLLLCFYSHSSITKIVKEMAMKEWFLWRSIELTQMLPMCDSFFSFGAHESQGERQTQSQTDWLPAEREALLLSK